MTKTEFDNTKFEARMKCYYKKYLHHIKGVDFGEGTIWISQHKDDEGRWIPYKHVEIIP